MAVQSISPDDLSRGLPPVIGLPRCLPHRPAYRKTALGEVLAAEELPPYLLLGSLDRSTFQCSDMGWSARRVGDVPETYVEAKFDRRERQLQLRQVWRGIDGGYSITPADDFGHVIQLLYLPFPESWDRAMAGRLELRFGTINYVSTASIRPSSRIARSRAASTWATDRSWRTTRCHRTRSCAATTARGGARPTSKPARGRSRRCSPRR
jgi:hypothetical protein